MITRVLLKNWRSHEDSELNFTAGTNALLGILGSGKSSVLDAVCFCLFGTFPNLQARKLKIEDILMKKPVQKDKAEVEVYFAEDGKTYSVKRVIERGKGTTYSEIRENGKVIESPNTSRVNELVEKVLKVSYDLFSKAIYSEQNSLDYFLKIPSGQRMKKIDELLGIDRFEKARTNSVSLANKLMERRAARKAVVDAAGVEEAEGRMREMRASIDGMKAERARLDARMKEVSLQRTRMERELSETRKTKATLEGLRLEDRATESLVNDTYASLQRLEEGLKGMDKDAVEKNLREVTRYLSEMETMLKDEQRRHAKLQDQAAKARAEAEVMQQDKIASLEREVARKLQAKEELGKGKLDPDKFEEEMAEKRKAVEKFEAEMEVVRMRVSDLKEAIEHINEIEGRCPTCDAKMTEEKKVLLIKKKQFEVDKLKEKFAKAGEKSEVSKRQVAELEERAGKLQELLDAVKDLDKMQAELNNTRNVYAILKEQSDGLQAELESVRSEVEAMDQRMRAARDSKSDLEMRAVTVRDYNEKRGKIEALLMKRKQLTSSIKSVEDSLVGRENSQLERAWEELVTEEKTLSGGVAGANSVIQEREARLMETEAKVAGAMKSLEEMRGIDRTVEDLKRFEKALEATQAQLRREFVASVNYTMNELWSNLYPYQDFSSVQLAVEEGDYVLQLQERSGKWVNVEGFASGGERSIAALTLRMAFALVLAPQLKWLVLDEPTANMDTKAVEDLATTLSEHIGDFIEQTFLITHDEKLESAVTGFAYRFERDKGKEEPTRIVQL